MAPHFQNREGFALHIQEKPAQNQYGTKGPYGQLPGRHYINGWQLQTIQEAE